VCEIHAIAYSAFASVVVKWTKVAKGSGARTD
jgi:hypothetical protein